MVCIDKLRQGKKAQQDKRRLQWNDAYLRISSHAQRVLLEKFKLENKDGLPNEILNKVICKGVNGENVIGAYLPWLNIAPEDVPN